MSRAYVHGIFTQAAVFNYASEAYLLDLPVRSTGQS